MEAVILQEVVPDVWWSELMKLGSVFVIMGAIIWWLLGNRKDLIAEHVKIITAKDMAIASLNAEIKDYSKDYKELANKSLSVLILVDDKLKNDATTNENIKDIHRIVQAIYEIQQRHNTR